MQNDALRLMDSIGLSHSSISYGYRHGVWLYEVQDGYPQLAIRKDGAGQEHSEQECLTLILVPMRARARNTISLTLTIT